MKTVNAKRRARRALCPECVEEKLVADLFCGAGGSSTGCKYYGASGCQDAAQPLPTVTTRDRFGVVLPVTHRDPSNRGRSLDEPLPTVTSAPRGELAFAQPEPFLTAAFGERPGQAARVRSVEEPAPTLCAQGRVPLVEGACSRCGGIDILFRMLDPEELAAAMGFNDGEDRYEFCGTKTQVTRQIGNAVPVNMAAALVGAIFADERRGT